MFRMVFAGALALGCALPALAQQYDDRRPPSVGVSYGYADVLRADPIYEYVRGAPREECYDEDVVRHGSRDTTGATVLGAIVGGALGNTVGKGDGRKAATIAGAVAGGAIAHDAAKRHGGRDYVTTEQRCHIVDDGRDERRVIGYDVEYRFRGEVYQSRLNYDPGERLRVRVEVAPAE